MRPSTAATLALVLSASTTAVQGASPPPEGGSIQALLTRYSARTHKALPLDAIPKDLKVNGTAAVGVVGNTTVLVVPVVPKNETASVQNPKAATKLVKRTKAKKEEDLAVEKRSFVIDSSVVEEPSSTAVANPSPSVLAAAQEAIVILSSVPSELALPVASSTEEAISSTARARKPYNPAHAKHNRRNDLSHDNRRRWVWSTSVIQDGDEDALPPDLTRTS
ncbi:hypothetical protein BCR35DRAFT_122848 [Leucosporidium creatinivorum]|uniref:Uncharacterized protein n=1 Tax=Leucosporidium creatinivorum TaxID=106004 RepID=A0A1Y2EXC9_9BASI|nr:hypothetical protein BCR35DRAFT_122848 [Leucosporidium creatinivorum]